MNPVNHFCLSIPLLHCTRTAVNRRTPSLYHRPTQSSRTSCVHPPALECCLLRVLFSQLTLKSFLSLCTRTACLVCLRKCVNKLTPMLYSTCRCVWLGSTKKPIVILLRDTVHSCEVKICSLQSQNVYCIGQQRCVCVTNNTFATGDSREERVRDEVGAGGSTHGVVTAVKKTYVM